MNNHDIKHTCNIQGVNKQHRQTDDQARAVHGLQSASSAAPLQRKQDHTWRGHKRRHHIINSRDY